MPASYFLAELVAGESPIEHTGGHGERGFLSVVELACRRVLIKASRAEVGSETLEEV